MKKDERIAAEAARAADLDQYEGDFEDQQDQINRGLRYLAVIGYESADGSSGWNTECLGRYTSPQGARKVVLDHKFDASQREPNYGESKFIGEIIELTNPVDPNDDSGVLLERVFKMWSGH